MNKYIDIYDYLHASKEALRELIQKHTGDHWTINARVNGHTAAIAFNETAKSAVFFLPEVKDGRLTRTQADAFTGYWLHEAHHILFTVMNDREVTKLQAEYGKYGFSMLNCVEDARIEQRGTQQGIAANLLPCLIRLRNHTFLNSGAATAPATVEQHLPYAIKLAMGEAYGLHTIAADWLSKLPEPFQKCMAHAVEALKADRLNDTHDALVLTREILQMIAEEQSGDEQSEDEQSEDDESGDEQSEDEQSEDGESGDGGESSSESGGDAEPADVLDDTLAGIIADTDASDGLTSEMRDQIEEAYDFMNTLERYETRVGVYSPIEHLEDVQKARVTALLKGTQRLENGLRHALIAAEDTGVDTYRKRGRVDARALSRLKAGSTTVFKRRWDTPAHSTAVALVIDRSVSMRGTRWEMAMTLERAATRTFQRARVPFSVLTYNSFVQVKKTAEQSMSHAQLESNCYTTRPTGMTNTTQAILAAADTLANVAADRKMILVVTDGGCNLGADAVSEAIRFVKNARGIDEVNALNVDCGPDEAEYDHAIEVDAESLPREGLKALLQRA